MCVCVAWLHPLSRLQEWSSECPTQVLVFSARYCGRFAPEPPSCHPSLTIYPFSDHSSFTELKRFVGLVAPCQVKPIVHNFSGDQKITQLRVDMSYYSGLLSSRKRVRLLNWLCVFFSYPLTFTLQSLYLFLSFSLCLSLFLCFSLCVSFSLFVSLSLCLPLSPSVS